MDNSSGFLGRRPHRRHPGVLQLPCVRVPPVLAAAARALLLESSLPGVEAQVPALRNYLWSRRVPVEPEELQRRARRLEERLLEDAGGACRRVGRTEGPRPAERGPPLPLPLPGAPGRDGLRLCSGNAAP